jgi:protein-disulfide isomerase
MKIQRPLPHFALLFVITITLSLALSTVMPVLADSVPDTLRPPKGAQTALVVFEDLQCPQCGRVAPLLEQAARTYKIPLVQHDFPLPMHNWSFDAAVMARYFDTQSKELGNEFRLNVFEHQMEITPMNLRGFAERFASAHKLSLPFAVEKDPKLIALVNADKELGQNLHIDHTPTIWIVSSRHPDKPYVEVKDTSQLYVMIDAMK